MLCSKKQVRCWCNQGVETGQAPKKMELVQGWGLPGLGAPISRNSTVLSNSNTPQLPTVVIKVWELGGSNGLKGDGVSAGTRGSPLSKFPILHC